MLKSILFPLSSLLVVSLLFVCMARMISAGAEVGLETPPSLISIDFVRPETEVVQRVRARQIQREKVQPKKVLSKVSPKQRTKLAPASFKFPAKSFDLSLAGGLAVGNLKPGFGEVARGLVPLVYIPPQYPMRAKRLGKEGFVELEFTIDPNGDVREIVVKKASPAGIFEREAIRAVSRWKFKPQIENDRAVARRAVQVIKFSLEG